jgi:arylsulfatase
MTLPSIMIVRAKSSTGYMNDFFGREFWRFVSVQQVVATLANTAIVYPPMQAPASFNLSTVKAKIDEMIKEHAGQ